MGNRRPAVRPLINAVLALILMGVFAFGRRDMAPSQRWLFVGLLAAAVAVSLWRAFTDPGSKR